MGSLSRKAEDYLEAIYVISKEKGFARVKDIADMIRVKPPSAIEMLQKLDAMGLLIYKKYDGVRLTEKGENIGKTILYRHEAIREFLEIIDVPLKIANEDACVMEHDLHPKTVEQIKNLVNFVKTAPDHPQWLMHFQHFCKTGEHQCEEKDGEKRD